MQTHKLNLIIKKPFGNLLRARCVLIAAQDDEGNILLGAKTYFYPPTICRLLGGGVDEGETFVQAATRELEEELGICVRPEQLKSLVLFDTLATDQDGKAYHNETVVYRADIGDQHYQAGDDVTDIVKMTPAQLYDLGERYERLPETLWYNGEEGLYAWADYAKLYGPVHKVTAEKIKIMSEQA